MKKIFPLLCNNHQNVSFGRYCDYNRWCCFFFIVFHFVLFLSKNVNTRSNWMIELKNELLRLWLWGPMEKSYVSFCTLCADVVENNQKKCHLLTVGNI